MYLGKRLEVFSPPLLDKKKAGDFGQMASGHSNGLSSRAEEAAHAIVQLLTRELSSPSTSSAPPLSTPVRAAASPVPSAAASDSRVKQAMKRQFPGMFNSNQPRGKKRFYTPSPQTVKKILPEPTQLTPKGSDELELAHAGLGKRMISMAENLKHNEIVAALEEEFPKLGTLKGGWMFFKSTGGSGRRRLSVIPTDSEGYSTRLLKAATSNGKNMVYIVPLQEQLCTLPLPYDCAEFSKMPQSQCITCGSKMPLQLLPLHVEGCNGTTTETDSVTGETDASDIEQIDPPPTEIQNSLEICPICQECFPTDVLPSHASTCCDGLAVTDRSEAASREELPGPSVPHLPTPVSAAWVNEVDPRKACELFREELLQRNAECPHLFLSVDMFDAEEQDSSLISFYKQHNVNWAAPLKCRLRGDAAVGDGVKRHVLSMAMLKLKTGFSINLGSSALTSIFEGEKEHLVPSAAAVLRESNLFEMAGRMIGHSFLHSGIGLSGLSLPVVTLLTGGNTDTAAAAAALTLQDCPDLDHRETIGFLRKAELTASETTCVTDLCLSWDLPVPTSTNHDWLFQELLTHAVLRRVKQPVKQIRKGLKETGIWPLLSERPDVHPIFFPREVNEELNSQTVIQHIIWPQPSYDSDEDEDDPVPLQKISLITGFLRKFIEEASPEVLRDLMKFWVGWEQPTKNLVVEVVTSTYPVALTCFHKLKLPSHYQTYTMFHRDLKMALSSISSGFVDAHSMKVFALLDF